MDRRGRGLSAGEAPGPYALAREAEDVAAVLAAIGPDALVLAHSYGGTCLLAAVAGAGGARAARLLVYEPAFGTPVGPVFPAAALDAVEAAIARDDPEAALETFFADVLLLGPAEIRAMRGTPAWRARVACAHTLAREAREANAFSPRGRRRRRAAPVPPRHGERAAARALDAGGARLRAGQLGARAARPGSRRDGHGAGAVRRRGRGVAQPLRWKTKANFAPFSRERSSISPRAPRKRPVPPVIASVLSLASKNGPSTVIWPPSRRVVQLHS